MLISLVDVVGWSGAVFVVIAYAGIAMGRMKLHSRSYLLLNLFGGAGIMINSAYYKAFPSAILNVVWIAVALYGLFVVSNVLPINHPHHHSRKGRRHSKF